MQELWTGGCKRKISTTPQERVSNVVAPGVLRSTVELKDQSCPDELEGEPAGHVDLLLELSKPTLPVNTIREGSNGSSGSEVLAAEM